MDNKASKLPKIIIHTLICAVIISLCAVFHEATLNLCLKVAVLSAKSYLPQSGVALSLKQTTYDNTTTEEAETTSVNTTEKQTTEKTATAITKKDEAPKNNTSNFTNTPDDILKLMSEAEKSLSKSKKGGNIKTAQFINDGVTDVFGEVRVKNVNKTDIDIEQILKERIDLKVDKKKPAVLIFHTHTTETYQLLDKGYYTTAFQTRSNDENKNMLRVGKAITEQIESMGFKVIHDTEIHDSKYSGSYARSRKKCEEYLKKYPSIQVVLDIHRDAIHYSDGTRAKPTCEVQGKKAAQIMIISGCQEKGNAVENFPDWRYNLTFAVHLQKTLEDLYPGITRPLYFSPRKYNMDLTHCSLLLEVGTDANTLEEAVLTGKCIGTAVSKILKDYQE